MFESAYQSLLELHRSKRSGERLRRIQNGLGHAERMYLENVWWPAFGHFDDLHPEYEVSDFKDGSRYLDFAYLRAHVRLAIEIDGFNSHVRQLTRWQFSDHLQRQNHLILDGWYLLRFSYDDVAERPRLCQQTVQQAMGRLLGLEERLEQASVFEREVIRLARRVDRPVVPGDLCRHFGIGPDFARRILRGMVQKGWLRPAGGGVKRIRAYRLIFEDRAL